MKFFYDLLPVIVFFVVYKTTDDAHGGLLNATAALIVVAIGQTLYEWFRFGKVAKQQLIMVGVAVILGGATLAFQDDRFIKWKPTVVNWMMAVAFLGSEFIGAKNFVERLMGASIQAPKALWRRLNVTWIVFFIFMGGLNLWVAFNFETETWVNFKLFGSFGLTLVFIGLQTVYLIYNDTTQAPKDNRPTDEK